MRIASFKVQNVVGSFGCCSIKWWAKSGLGYLLLLMMRNYKVWGSTRCWLHIFGWPFGLANACPSGGLSWQKVSLGYLLMMRNERVFGSFEGHENEAGEPVSSFCPVIFAIKNSTISLFFVAENYISSSNSQIQHTFISLNWSQIIFNGNQTKQYISIQTVELQRHLLTNKHACWKLV